MSNWDKIFKPVVVLCVICLVITGALAATNSVTDPIIKENIRIAQDQARKELIPEAGSFSEVTLAQSVDKVSGIYEADTGGYVITASGKGYGGDVVVMVAFDADGTITRIKVTEQAETKGIGSKVVTLPDGQSLWDQFGGKTAGETLTVGDNIDKVSGATISSRAVTTAVNNAINGYNAIG